MQENIIYINTDQYNSPKPATTLVEGRENFVKMQYVDGMPEVTIWIQAYNQLEKTKRCVESVLKYTKGICYDLILVDNGSTDPEVLEYFKSVSYQPKRIMRFTKNLESGYPHSHICIADIAPFFVVLPCDIVVTPNWLHNLLICIKSDRKIGMVNPVSSNVSNLQEVELQFHSYEEMEKIAGEFNKSNPKKWEERLRLVTLGTLYRKEALYAIGMPLADIGFFHDFADDDLSYRVRRMGYKTILAGDTWIHHDHDIRNFENKDKEQFQHSLSIGKANFMEKYYGVNPWKDDLLYWIQHIHELPIAQKESKRILGIDVAGGEGILLLKNHLKKNGIDVIELDAFTQDARYQIDLNSVCESEVICDKIEGIRLYLPHNSYDYIMLGEYLNSYNEPFVVLQDAMNLLNENGVLMLRIKNTYNYIDLLHMLGERKIGHSDIVYHITYEQLLEKLVEVGNVVYAGSRWDIIDDSVKVLVDSIIDGLSLNEEKDTTKARLFIKEFFIMVQK